MAIQVKELDRPGSNNTVIGESILVSGKLDGDEDPTVRGRVEGSITLTKTLIIEPSGVVKADATVRNAIVSGVVVGNITATESVELTREGRMVGDIKAPRVIIVDGAAFRGRVDMGNADGRPLSERPARPVSAPSSAPKILRPVPPVAPRPPAPPAPPAAARPHPGAATTIARPPPPPAMRPPAPPRPPEAGATRPSAPPAPPQLKPSGGPPSAPPAPPAAVGIGKRKVIVKRKK